MKTKKPLLLVKSDFVFKKIFGDQRNVDILADFLQSVLDIPNYEYDRLTIVDPYIKKESEDDKYGILDVKVHTVSGNVIHVEIQIRLIPEMKARTVYSQSKLVTEQMSSGQNWSVIKRVVSIVITDYELVPGDNKYHHQFRYRTDEGIEFTNLVEVNTLELQKLPPEEDSTDLWYWMKFIKSDDEEVIDMLAQKSPQMKKAVGVLKELSADERTRMLYEKREMARMDFESMRDGAIREEREKWLGIVMEKDTALAEKDTALAEKDTALADKDTALADKDTALADKDAQIAELLARLGESN